MFMKILFASDSFKGTMDCEKIGKLLNTAVSKVFPDAITENICVADGGEGTMKVVTQELGGTVKKVSVKGPLFEDVEAEYGILPDNRAIIEMAQASGLPLVDDDKKNPLYTTTFGTGQLIKDALDSGARHITISVGGSATNDGGIGALSALGFRFLDGGGNELKGTGESLEKICRVDLSDVYPAVKEAKFDVMCDVTNVLTGVNGASHVFAYQKGADEETVLRLEQGMINFARVTAETVNADYKDVSGMGAAGGLAFGLKAYLNAEIKSGIDAVLDLINFNEKLKDTDLVITGEGRIDVQTVNGKVVSGVGLRCKKAGVPAVAIVGGMLKGYDEIFNYGIMSVMPTVNIAMTLNEAMERSEELYLDAALRMLRFIKCGIDLDLKIVDTDKKC